MVWEQGPGVALGLGFLQDHSESFQKRGAILIVPKDFPAFNSTGHYMLQDTGGIKSGLAGHGLFFWHGFHRLRCFYKSSKGNVSVYPVLVQDLLPRD